MLNDYHLQFLERLVHHGARFLVVGGQARFVHHGSPTRDLDIWVDIAPNNQPALERCLIEWTSRHPLHSLQNFTPPLNLRPNVQIPLPDGNAAYLRRDGEPAEILLLDRIDILTSIADADFSSYHGRANWLIVEGSKIAFLCAEDLDTISPRKADLGGT